MAWALPLTPAWWGPGWASPRWRPPGGRLVLVPGTLAAGQRLPLDSVAGQDYPGEGSFLRPGTDLPAPPPSPSMTPPTIRATVVDPQQTPSRTALVVQPRDGHVRVFLPPLEQAEKFVELVAVLERVAAETGTALVFEGYEPPPDPRLQSLLITPDPGVLEVNLHPADNWAELAETTVTTHRLAAELGLRAETFGLDGRHRAPAAATTGRSAVRSRPDPRCSADPIYWSACSPTGSTIRRCRTRSRDGSSARPARPRGSTRAARRPCTSWRSPSPRSSG